jgi:class 3 adenylate cyclase
MAEGRKTVTVVFCDVAGSTSLGETIDPEALRRIMERYFEEARAALEAHGGTVEKFIGDAVMAVFGVPAVHEDDALRAVRAAAELRERLAALDERISVRTGVNTGDVVVGDPAAGHGFVSGDAVNVAARLEQAAQPGDILIGEVTYRLVRDAVRVEDLEPLSVKGKVGRVPAKRLLEVLPDVPAFTRRFDAPFVGRERQLSILSAALEQAAAEGTCRLVTIVAPPGVGKSRLAREFVASAQERSRIVVGRCLSYGEGITYWPLVEIVRQVAGNDTRPGLRAVLAAEEDGELVANLVAAAVGDSEIAARGEEIFWAVRRLFEALPKSVPYSLSSTMSTGPSQPCSTWWSTLPASRRRPFSSSAWPVPTCWRAALPGRRRSRPRHSSSSKRSRRQKPWSCSTIWDGRPSFRQSCERASSRPPKAIHSSWSSSSPSPPRMLPTPIWSCLPPSKRFSLPASTPWSPPNVG